MSAYDNYNSLVITLEDNVAIVSINRPEAFNAINEQVLEETARFMNQAVADEEVKAIILGTFNDKFFAAGADIREVLEATPFEAERFISLVHTGLKRIYRCPKPTVAAVSGLTLGGGLELTLVCDFRIAADNAMFSLPEINIGIMPGGGGTQLLPRLLGAAKAKEMILLGEMVDAQTACNIGLVSRVVPFADLKEEAMKLAKRAARKPPISYRMAKNLIHSSMDVDVSSGMVAEKEAFAMLFSTADQREGMKAFLENRKPNYVGR